MFKNLWLSSLTGRFSRLLTMMIDFGWRAEPRPADGEPPGDGHRGKIGPHPDYRLFAQ
ncbi:MAG: hypothetical protein ABL904_07190 [Hyphomicrobiaceae bacterium]